MIAREEAAHAKYERNTMATSDMTVEEARKRFEAVCDSKNWKNPVNKFVGKVSSVERRKISEAITFFTGSVAEWESSNGGKHWTVKAAGYYAAIGA
jgi:hypothetical protein